MTCEVSVIFSDVVALAVSTQHQLIAYEEFDYSTALFKVLYSKLCDLKINSAFIVFDARYSTEQRQSELSVCTLDGDNETVYCTISEKDNASIRDFFSHLDVGSVNVSVTTQSVLERLSVNEIGITKCYNEFALLYRTGNKIDTCMCSKEELEESLFAFASKYDCSNLHYLDNEICDLVSQYFGGETLSLPESAQARLSVICYVFGNGKNAAFCIPKPALVTEYETPSIPSTKLEFDLEALDLAIAEYEVQKTKTNKIETETQKISFDLEALDAFLATSEEVSQDSNLQDGSTQSEPVFIEDGSTQSEPGFIEDEVTQKFLKTMQNLEADTIEAIASNDKISNESESAVVESHAQEATEAIIKSSKESEYKSTRFELQEDLPAEIVDEIITCTVGDDEIKIHEDYLQEEDFGFVERHFNFVFDLPKHQFKKRGVLRPFAFAAILLFLIVTGLSIYFNSNNIQIEQSKQVPYRRHSTEYNYEIQQNQVDVLNGSDITVFKQLKYLI